MQFYDAIITNEGVRMLTAASFSNKLTFTRLLFSADNVTLGVTTQSLEHSWGNGHIDNYASAADGSFVIYGSASNAQDYGMAYGFAVYGYLNSEGPENEHIVFVANADGVPTYVNSQSGAATRFQFAIKAKINLSDQVIRIDPNYNGLVSNIAFQDLLERTVTTHSATDTQVGDDQTVRGHKEFADGIGVGGPENGWGLEVDNYNDAQDNSIVRVRTTNGAYYANGIEFKHRDEEGSYVQNVIYTNSNIVPFNGAIDLALGDRDRTFAAAYVRNIYTSAIYATQRIRVPTVEVSTKLNTPLIEVVDGLNFYNTRLEDDNIRLTWYENELALKFQAGAVNATVEFDVPVKFNSNVTINPSNTLSISSATIGQISSGVIAVHQLEATALETGEAIVNGSVKTKGLELRGIIGPDNYPIAGPTATSQGVMKTPIGSIRLVSIQGLSEGSELVPNARLFGYTLVDQTVSRDAQTDELKFTDSQRQMESSGGNYVLLHSVKRGVGEISPLALVIKVRDDMAE